MTFSRITFGVSLVIWVLAMSLLIIWNPDERGDDILSSMMRRNLSADTWYGIFRDGRKLGYGRLSVAADAAGDAVEYLLHTYVRIVSPCEISAVGGIVAREPGGLSTFFLNVHGGERISLKGSMKDGYLDLDYEFGGRPYPWIPGEMLSDGKSAGRVRLPAPVKAGPAYGIKRDGREAIKLRGVFIPATRYSIAMGRDRVLLWVDAAGSIRRAVLPGGISIVEEPRALAESSGGGVEIY